MSRRNIRIVADNPSPMTLDGTNTYVLTSTDGSNALLIDPGPAIDEHREAILAAIGERHLAAIVLTHEHWDHSELLSTVDQWAPGVPVHAVKEEFCTRTEPLQDGDQVVFGDGPEDRVEIIATPGHTLDSVSVRHGEVLYTGDTVLGEGTTMVSHPEGSLRDYLRSLEVLIDRVSSGQVTVIEPAHGPTVEDPAAVLDHYRSHRLERIEQVKAAVAQGATTASAVCDIVYADVPSGVRFAAEQIVRAQLTYLGHDAD